MRHLPKRYRLALVCAALLCYPLYLHYQLNTARSSTPQPQLILMLGGEPDREPFTADFAHQHPDLPIVVSSGSASAVQTFDDRQVPRDRITFDCRASDTVSNFTTLARQFQDQGIRHVYLVTSQFHMPRSTAIATVIFGSYGIAFTPVPMPSPRPMEPAHKTLRDVGRSMVWLTTGRSGSSLKPRISPCV